MTDRLASNAPFDTPRLLIDIGGTYARFALETAAGQWAHPAQWLCADHADFETAVRAYLASCPPQPVLHAAVAVANPVEGDTVRMTNSPWQFSIEAMRTQLGLHTLVVVNDFTALAMALPRLGPSDKRQVGDGAAREHSVVGLLGAGTGLGVSGVIPAGRDWIALGAEGGHASFSPRDEREVAVLRYVWQQLGEQGDTRRHVSFERLLSGPGLELIYQALSDRAGPTHRLSAPEITRRALDTAEPDLLCAETLDVFCAMLGTAAANLAVTLGALGGIYIGGGIVPRLGEWFDRSRFRERFEDKGRFSNYLAQIPTWVITAENATFLGMSAILAAQLQHLESSAILNQIQRSRNSLSPAERRVADLVLAQPRTVLNDPVADIALAARVSQPTVIRFCRSLGCDGLSDFKLRLASGLTGTVPVTHTQVTGNDSTLELGAKVLNNTASAVLQLRDHLNRDSIEHAITLLAGAHRVDCFAVGDDSTVAQDAQFKLLRLGLPSGAYVDTRLQSMAAQVLGPGDVALLISANGRKDELLAVADMARERGAAVVALTASQSPLARKADVALLVDHAEDADMHLPMVSRVLHLTMVDILAVGLAMQKRTPLTLTTEPHLARGTHRATPGVSAASPLASLTSHSKH